MTARARHRGRWDEASDEEASQGDEGEDRQGDDILSSVMEQVASVSTARKLAGLRLVTQKLGTLARHPLGQEIGPLVAQVRRLVMQGRDSELHDEGLTALCCLALHQGVAFAGCARMILNDLVGGLDRTPPEFASRYYAIGFIATFSRLGGEEAKPLVEVLASVASNECAAMGCTKAIALVCAVQPVAFTIEGSRAGYASLSTAIAAAFAAGDRDSLLVGLDALEVLWSCVEGNEDLEREVLDGLAEQIERLPAKVKVKDDSKAVKRRGKEVRRVLDGEEERSVALQLCDQRVPFDGVRKLALLAAVKQVARDGFLPVMENAQALWSLFDYRLKERKIALREKFAGRGVARKKHTQNARSREQDLKERRRRAAVREERSDSD